MSALTLRGLSPDTERRLKVEARKAGVSMNRLILQRLEGETHGAFKPHVHHDLDALFGTMSAADLGAIEAAAASQRQTDRKLWR